MTSLENFLIKLPLPFSRQGRLCYIGSFRKASNLALIFFNRLTTVAWEAKPRAVAISVWAFSWSLKRTMV